PQSLFTEPPIAEDDTKQRLAISVEKDEVQTDVTFNVSEIRATGYEQTKEPDFLAGVDADTAMTIPKPTEVIPPAPINEKSTVEVTSLSNIPEKPTVEVVALTPEPEKNPYELPRINEPTSLDTSQLSIFDIFGMPKPSETQQMMAVQASAVEAFIPTPTPPPAPTLQKSVEVDMSSERVGRRILLRRNMVKVRKP
ncbi:MAG TPA: hypothetical protein PLZ51_15800, partial [Aggregatilineales bacterium]|nr:hypothetical protein [Aggregatilineales bacterium]